MDYRYGSHTVFQIEYHFVWVTKYRYILTGEVGERVRKLDRETCEAFEIRIVKGVVSKDHVHILVSCPPTMHRDYEAHQRAHVGQAVRRVSAHQEAVLGRHFWARALFVRRSVR
ncbi:IS200/IS605 family transposase [Paraburkholderia xenovorans]